MELMLSRFPGLFTDTRQLCVISHKLSISARHGAAYGEFGPMLSSINTETFLSRQLPSPRQRFKTIAPFRNLLRPCCSENLLTRTTATPLKRSEALRLCSWSTNCFCRSVSRGTPSAESAPILRAPSKPFSTASRSSCCSRARHHSCSNRSALAWSRRVFACTHKPALCDIVAESGGSGRWLFSV